MKANFLVSFLGLASSFVTLPTDDPQENDRGGPQALTARTLPPATAGGWSDVIKITPAGAPLGGSIFVWLSPGDSSTRKARFFDWLTIGPKGARSRSLDRVLTLLRSEVARPGKRGHDGRLHLTNYGAPRDPHLDTLTAQGMGNRGNRLRPTSIALSSDLVKRYGLRGGEEIHLEAGGVTYFLGHFDDTTARHVKSTVDVYDPEARLGHDSFLVMIPKGRWQLVARRAEA